MVFVQFVYDFDENFQQESLRIMDITNEKSQMIKENYLRISNNIINKCKSGDDDYFVVCNRSNFQTTFKVIDEEQLKDDEDAWNLKELIDEYEENEDIMIYS